MKRLEFFSLPQKQQAYWLEQIRNKDWPAAKSLAGYLDAGTFLDRSKGRAEIYLLVEDDQLVSFCTLAGEDDVSSPLAPWIGYVYTDPAWRGHRAGFSLLESVIEDLKREHVPAVYISSGHQGLYEKLGFVPLEQAAAKKGYTTTIFQKLLEDQTESRTDRREGNEKTAGQ